MPRRTFMTELKTMIYAMRGNNYITTSAIGNNIINDLTIIINYKKGYKQRRYLVWSLLIGRSVDCFPDFFLNHKRQPIVNRNQNTFRRRVNRIRDPNRNLTANPALIDDLTDVVDLRNDLFHNSGRHFNQTEMETFVFTTVNCIIQLINDL